MRSKVVVYLGEIQEIPSKVLLTFWGGFTNPGFAKTKIDLPVLNSFMYSLAHSSPSLSGFAWSKASTVVNRSETVMALLADTTVQTSAKFGLELGQNPAGNNMLTSWIDLNRSYTSNYHMWTPTWRFPLGGTPTKNQVIGPGLGIESHDFPKHLRLDHSVPLLFLPPQGLSRLD